MVDGIWNGYDLCINESGGGKAARFLVRSGDEDFLLSLYNDVFIKYNIDDNIKSKFNDKDLLKIKNLFFNSFIKYYLFNQQYESIFDKKKNGIIYNLYSFLIAFFVKNVVWKCNCPINSPKHDTKWH